MIHTVRYRNFKALRDVEIANLGPFTAFIGPNSAGKTSVLQGLHYLAQLATTPPEEVFKDVHDMASLQSHGTTEQINMALEGCWEGTNGAMALWAKGVKRTRGPLEWDYTIDREWGKKQTTLGKSDLGQAARISRAGTEGLDDVLSATAILRLDAHKMALPAYSDAQVPEVGPDGEGLAAVLAHLQLEQPDRFVKIVACLREVIPAVERIRFSRAEVKRVEPEGSSGNGRSTKPADRSFVERVYMGNRIIFDMAGADHVPAHAVSEGTLLMLGLLTVLSESKNPRVLLVDDLERALHPKALKPMVAQLRVLLKQNPMLQLMATSHSPFLVDHLSYDEIRLMTTGEDGSAVCGSLQEHPDFERWKDMMLPGEFWSMHAESWLKEKRTT